MESPCRPGSGRVLHITPVEEDLQTRLLLLPALRSPLIHPRQNRSTKPGVYRCKLERQNVGLFDGSDGVQFAQIVAKEP